MELIAINSDAYLEITNKLSEISKKLDHANKKNPLTDVWLDIFETCMLLKISKRTLQSYRDKLVLPFSQIGGKIYFRAADIEQHLMKHYVNPKSSKNR